MKIVVKVSKESCPELYHELESVSTYSRAGRLRCLANMALAGKNINTRNTEEDVTPGQKKKVTKPERIDEEEDNRVVSRGFNAKGVKKLPCF